MRTKTIKLYQYNELSEEAKESARNSYREHALDYEWWESVFYDAKQIGLEISSFDIYRKDIDGRLTESADYTANKIKESHGDKCGTVAEALYYEKTMADFLSNAEKDEHGELATYALDHEKEEIEKEFLRSLLQEYLSMLEKEYDYLLSDESCEEMIVANEYEYTENGAAA
jgi:hypothetical protein